MAEFYARLMQDNGGYFLSAYVIVFGTLFGYAFWLRSRLKTLTQSKHRDARTRDTGLDA